MALGFQKQRGSCYYSERLFSSEIGRRLHQLVLYQCIWAPDKRVGVVWRGVPAVVFRESLRSDME